MYISDLRRSLVVSRVESSHQLCESLSVVCIDLVTMAGTEYTMQTNITHYEDMMQLEDDILCFLPTVSDIEVFGCE